MKQTSLIFSWVIVLAALTVGTSSLYAYPTYSRDRDATNCRLCHGDFGGGNYISTSDGQDWGNLHNLHRNVMLSGPGFPARCQVCHSWRSDPTDPSNFFPVRLNSSATTLLAPISCVGCHGREEDHEAQGSPTPGGRGAGLRQHHTNAGVTICMGCHSDANPANYTPVGENVLPPYYFTPDNIFTNKPTDSCNSFGEENYAGIWEGLDNDGDGVYDVLDSDCRPPFGKMTVCHIPRRNPAAAKTISVNAASLRAHLGHGDVARSCEDLFASADTVRGGRMYDQFWSEAGSQPMTDHPLWALQSSNTRTGSDTWRCKECHGWDYKGVDGAYGSGSHRTGFPGIFGTTLTPERVVSLLADRKGHNYLSQGLTWGDLWDLAKFVVAGQIDTDTILTGNQFTGNPTVGQTLFESGIGDGPGCAACHGNDGMRTPPTTGSDPSFDEFPQVLATDNPWEFQHKVRYGHPGTAMRGIVVFGGTAQQTNDIGAHAQQNLSLP